MAAGLTREESLLPGVDVAAEASAGVEVLVRLKDEGNAAYVKGTEEGYQEACVIYGQVLSGMMQYEALMGSIHSEDLTMLKPTIFLNLAAANLSLHALESSFKCCNAAIVFINNPELPLDEMGLGEESEDISDFCGVPLQEPVLPIMKNLAEKALFRRGKCLMAMGGLHLTNAAKDYEHMLCLAGDTAGCSMRKTVQMALESIKKELNKMAQRSCHGTTTVATTTAYSISDSNSNIGDIHDGASVASAATTVNLGRKINTFGGIGNIDTSGRFLSEGRGNGNRSRNGNGNGNGNGYGYEYGNMGGNPQSVSGGGNCFGSAGFSKSLIDSRCGPSRNGASTVSANNEMTANGGFCLRRRGFWSQSVCNTVVYLRIDDLLSSARRRSAGNNTQFGHQDVFNDLSGAGSGSGSAYGSGVAGRSSASEWKVAMRVDSVAVHYNGLCVLPPQSFEYNIIVSSSLWTLESYGPTYSNREPKRSVTGSRDSGISAGDHATIATDNFEGILPPKHTHLVLYLQKAPSVEWFPGCEWWDRVFVDDEPIDTSTCTVPPSEMSELPHEAMLRADKSHDRFSKLTLAERDAELSYLSKRKKELFDAAFELSKTEEAAFQEEPEREELVNALRTEFPSIFVTSKPTNESQN